jgi:hypothetical protein
MINWCLSVTISLFLGVAGVKIIKQAICFRDVLFRIVLISFVFY